MTASDQLTSLYCDDDDCDDDDADDDDADDDEADDDDDGDGDNKLGLTYSNGNSTKFQ